MKEMNRRQFMKLASIGSLMAAYPGFVAARGLPATADVIFLQAGDEEYPVHAELFNKRIARKPRFIAVCMTETGVQQAIAQARALSLPVAVRSGGHSFEGFSLNDGGMSIDLTSMNQFELLANGQFRTGPACRLMEAYEYLIPKGRLLPLGSCAMVGIAGLTLGGGYGIFSRQYGLAIDWLKRIRMVDGQGRIHEVEQGADLFWACRGAGNGNFGVVTQLQFDTTPAPWQITRHLFKAEKPTPQRLKTIVARWFEVTAKLPNETFSAFVYNGHALNILVTNIQAKPAPVMDELLKMLEQVMDKRLPESRQDLLPGIRRYYGKFTPLYFKNASAGYYRNFQDIEQVSEQVFALVNRNPGLLYQINTLGGAIRRQGDANQLGCYPHREFGYLGEIQSYWDAPARESQLVAAVENVQALLAENGVKAHYSNYPDIGFTDWPVQYYGAENYARLQQIKQQYDPDNLFRHPQSIRLASTV